MLTSARSGCRGRIFSEAPCANDTHKRRVPLYTVPVPPYGEGGGGRTRSGRGVRCGGCNRQARILPKANSERANRAERAVRGLRATCSAVTERARPPPSATQAEANALCRAEARILPNDYTEQKKSRGLNPLLTAELAELLQHTAIATTKVR